MVDRIGPKKPFRHYIQQWMDKKELTQLEVSRRLDCGSGTISKLLSGQMELTAKWMAAFAFVLDVEIADLFRDPDMPTQDDLLRDEPPARRAQIIKLVKAWKQAG